MIFGNLEISALLVPAFSLDTVRGPRDGKRHAMHCSAPTAELQSCLTTRAEGAILRPRDSLRAGCVDSYEETDCR